MARGARTGWRTLGARRKDGLLERALTQAYCGLHLPHLVGIVEITAENPFRHLNGRTPTDHSKAMNWPLLFCIDLRSVLFPWAVENQV